MLICVDKFIRHFRRRKNPVLDACLRRHDGKDRHNNKYTYLSKLKVLVLAFIFIFCFEGGAGPCEETFKSSTRTQAVTTPEQISVRSAVWKLSTSKTKGTGFFITPNKLVTNFHVINEMLQHVSKVENITVSQEGSTRTLTIKGVLAVSALHDLALLETTQPVEHHLSIRRNLLQEHEELFITGYSGGQLTDVRKTNDTTRFSEGSTSFFVNHSKLDGTSGSPVVDVKNQVVGVQKSGFGNSVSSVNLNDLQAFVQRSERNKPMANLEQVIKSEIEDLSNLAQQGNPLAQIHLGFWFRDGKGVTKNLSRAAELFTQAAQQGYAEAQFNLGAMYDRGEGVTQNFSRAVHWYTQAAVQGHAGAQFNLGVMFYTGRGVRRDHQKAVELFQQAAVQGHAVAQFNLAVMYDRGEGVTQNFSRAGYWFKQAATQGDVKAQAILAKIRYD